MVSTSHASTRAFGPGVAPAPQSQAIKRASQPPVQFPPVMTLTLALDSRTDTDTLSSPVAELLRAFTESPTLTAQMNACHLLTKSRGLTPADRRALVTALVYCLNSQQRIPRTLLSAVQKAVESLCQDADTLTPILVHSLVRVYERGSSADLPYIDSLTQWKVASDAMVQHTAQFLQWIDTILSTELITHTTTTRTSPTPDVDNDADSSSDVSVAELDSLLIGTLRTFVTFVSRHRHSVTVILRTDTSNANGPLVQSLIRSLSQLLVNPVSHRDIVTQCSFVLVSFSLAMTTPHFTPLDVANRLINSDTYAPTRSPFDSDSGNVVIDAISSACRLSPMSPVPRVSLLRALISQCQPATLVHASNISGGQSLFRAIFDCLERVSASDNPEIRYYGLQSTEVWMNKATSIIKLAREAQMHIPASTSTRTPMDSISSIQQCLPNILSLISLNWDHPYRGIQSLTKPLFDRYLSLSSLLSDGAIDWRPTVDALIHSATQTLNRGSYQMLTALLQHCDPRWMIDRHPRLIERSFVATKSLAVWSLVAAFIEKLLLAIKPLSNTSSNGITCEWHEWRALFLRPLVACLIADSEQVRVAACGSFVHTLLTAIDPMSLAAIIDSIRDSQSQQYRSMLVGNDSEWQSSLDTRHRRALYSVLAVARRAGLINANQLQYSLTHSHISTTFTTTGSVPLSQSTLVNCLIHSDASLRLESLEFLCSNRFTAELPSAIELSLIQSTYPYLMRITDPSTRTHMLHTSLHRLFVRIRDSAAKVLRDECVRQGLEDRVDSVSVSTILASTQAVLGTSIQFVQWFAAFVITSAHPSAPFDRTAASMEILRLMLGIFNCQPHYAMQPSTNTVTVADCEAAVWSHILLTPLLVSGVSQSLWTSLGCSWQSVRSLAFEVLANYFPVPLPGLGDTRSLTAMLVWSWELCQSPRARDSESGAIAMKYLFRNYVQRMHYVIPIECIESQSQYPSQQPNPEYSIARSSSEAQLVFVQSLTEVLSANVSRMQSTPLSSRYHSAQSRLHGTLMVARFCIEEIPFSSLTLDSASERQWKAVIGKLIGTMADIASLSMRLHVPSHAYVEVQKKLLPIQTMYGRIHQAGVADTDGTTSLSALSLTDSSHMDACAGTITGSATDLVDLDNDDDLDVDCRGHVFSSIAGESSGSVSHQLMIVSSWLALRELGLCIGALVKTLPLTSAADIVSVSEGDAFGRILLCILFHSKHTGVLENCYTGLLQVCQKFLSLTERWPGLVHEWHRSLLDSIIQPRDDSWLRRSRGNAFALMAMCEAEPASRPSVLLLKSMECLIAMARGESKDWRSLVHGLNLLRSLFRHGALHVRCLPFLTQAFECAINAFRHSEWAVRNAAMIAFVPILGKACRAQAQQHANKMEAKEFFSQHVSIQPIVEQQLIEAANAVSGRGSSRPLISPALYPTLLLLSNLRSGDVSDRTVENFAGLLKPLRCHPHASIRALVAAALAGLTPTADTEAALVAAVAELPRTRTCTSTDKIVPISHNTIECQLAQIRALFTTFQSRLANGHSAQPVSVSLQFALALAERSWLGSSTMPVAGIRQHYLQLLFDALMLVSRYHPSGSILAAHWAHFTALVASAADRDPNTASASGLEAIGGLSLRCTAAALLIAAVSSSHYLPRMTVADRTCVVETLWGDLDSTMARSALEAFRFLLLHQPLLAKALFDCPKLHDLVCNLVARTATGADCLYRTSLLRTALALQDLVPSVHFDPADADLWRAIAAGATTVDPELRSAAIEAAGAVVRARSDSTNDNNAGSASAKDSDPEHVSEWLGWISYASADVMSPVLRLACSESVRRSYRLHATDGAALAAWRAMIVLMQDESDRVQTRTAEIVHSTLQPSQHRVRSAGESSSSPPPSEVSFGNGYSHPTITAHTLELACRVVAARFDGVLIVDQFQSLLVSLAPSYIAPYSHIPSCPTASPLWSNAPTSERSGECTPTIYLADNPNTLREIPFLTENLAALLAQTAGQLPSHALQRWRRAQYTLTSACLSAAASAEDAMVRARFEFTGERRPVGGWTYDSNVFESLHAALMLALALTVAKVSTQAGDSSGSACSVELVTALRAFATLSPSPHSRLLAVSSALLAHLDQAPGASPSSSLPCFLSDRSRHTLVPVLST